MMLQRVMKCLLFGDSLSDYDSTGYIVRLGPFSLGVNTGVEIDPLLLLSDAVLRMGSDALRRSPLRSFAQRFFSSGKKLAKTDPWMTFFSTGVCTVLLERLRHDGYKPALSVHNGYALIGNYDSALGLDFVRKSFTYDMPQPLRLPYFMRNKLMSLETKKSRTGRKPKSSGSLWWPDADYPLRVEYVDFSYERKMNVRTAVSPFNHGFVPLFRNATTTRICMVHELFAGIYSRDLALACSERSPPVMRMFFRASLGLSDISNDSLRDAWCASSKYKVVFKDDEITRILLDLHQIDLLEKGDLKGRSLVLQKSCYPGLEIPSFNVCMTSNRESDACLARCCNGRCGPVGNHKTYSQREFCDCFLCEVCGLIFRRVDHMVYMDHHEMHCINRDDPSYEEVRQYLLDRKNYSRDEEVAYYARVAAGFDRVFDQRRRELDCQRCDDEDKKMELD
jgi:hypothetical protein